MSTIKLEIEVSAENVKHVSAFLEQISAINGKVAKIEVVDAEEVKAPAPAKTPTPRLSRAKAKPAPVEAKPAPVEEEIEYEDDEDFTDAEQGGDEFEEEEEAITADDLRALQATKIDKHRPAIAAHYGKLGAKGISSLAPENFQKMFDFLSKLK